MAKLVAHALILQTIYLRNSASGMAASFHPNLPGGDLAPLFRTKHKGRIECNTTILRNERGAEQRALWCGFTSEFEFIYVRPKDDGQMSSENELDAHRMAWVFAEFTAAYTVNANDFPAQDVLGQWRQTALVQTWPYWREFCHGALPRMGLPVTLMPIMQIVARPAAAEFPAA